MHDEEPYRQGRRQFKGIEMGRDIVVVVGEVRLGRRQSSEFNVGRD
jgi:hypothetical protein